MSQDIFAFTISVSLFFSYYLYLNRRSRLKPDTCVYSLNAQIREQWVKMVMQSDKKDILAIQTIRNSMMAANFMASTAVLLIISSLSLSEKVGEWAGQWYSDSVNHEMIAELWRIKLGLLLFDFSVAFFCFAMAVRFFNHVGYMINLPPNESNSSLLAQQTSAYLNRAGIYYTRGTRTFFLSLPIIMWIFGPAFLMLTSLVLVSQLYLLDKVSK